MRTQQQWPGPGIARDALEEGHVGADGWPGEGAVQADAECRGEGGGDDDVQGSEGQGWGHGGLVGGGGGGGGGVWEVRGSTFWAFCGGGC